MIKSDPVVIKISALHKHSTACKTVVDGPGSGYLCQSVNDLLPPLLDM